MVVVVGRQASGSARNAAVERIVELVSVHTIVSKMHREATVLVVAAVAGAAEIAAEIAVEIAVEIVAGIVAEIVETCVDPVLTRRFEPPWLPFQQDYRVNFDQVVSLEAEEPQQIEFQELHWLVRTFH